MKDLLKLLEKRMKVLERRKQTPITLGRIVELQKVILEIQNIIIRQII
jgi:hypothetical protein